MKIPLKPLLLILVSFWLPSAWAIDCSRANTEVELTICGDAELMEADKSLGLAYPPLSGLMSRPLLHSLKHSGAFGDLYASLFR